MNEEQPDPVLARLARQRLAQLADDGARTTLDALLERMFDDEHRELLTVSAFGSSL